MSDAQGPIVKPRLRSMIVNGDVTILVLDRAEGLKGVRAGADVTSVVDVMRTAIGMPCVAFLGEVELEGSAEWAQGFTDVEAASLSYAWRVLADAGNWVHANMPASDEDRQAWRTSADVIRRMLGK